MSCAFLKALETKIQEYVKEVSSRPEAETLARVLWMALDDDTISRLQEAKDDEGRPIRAKDYMRLKAWIKKRQGLLLSRAPMSAPKQASNDMVYGVDAHAQAQEQPTMHAHEASAPDPWAENDPWAWQCQQAEEGWQVKGGNHLDPFGKGKGGKGKGKGKDYGKGGGQWGASGAPKPPMACYNCHGLYHPQRLCPSPPGSGDKGGSKCNICQGFGHVATYCTSNGGGKYTEPEGKGKGGGKGKGKGKLNALEEWQP